MKILWYLRIFWGPWPIMAYRSASATSLHTNQNVKHTNQLPWSTWRINSEGNLHLSGKPFPKMPSKHVWKSVESLIRHICLMFSECSAKIWSLPLWMDALWFRRWHEGSSCANLKMAGINVVNKQWVTAHIPSSSSSYLLILHKSRIPRAISTCFHMKEDSKERKKNLLLRKIVLDALSKSHK